MYEMKKRLRPFSLSGRRARFRCPNRFGVASDPLSGAPGEGQRCYFPRFFLQVFSLTILERDKMIGARVKLPHEGFQKSTTDRLATASIPCFGPNAIFRDGNGYFQFFQGISAPPRSRSSSSICLLLSRSQAIACGCSGFSVGPVGRTVCESRKAGPEISIFCSETDQVNERASVLAEVTNRFGAKLRRFSPLSVSQSFSLSLSLPASPPARFAVSDSLFSLNKNVELFDSKS